MQVKITYQENNIGFYDSSTNRCMWGELYYRIQDRALERIAPYIIKYFYLCIHDSDLPSLEIYNNPMLDKIIRDGCPLTFGTTAGQHIAGRQYRPVHEGITSGSIIKTNISPRLFMAENSSERKTLSSLAGYKDKFEAVLDSDAILRATESNEIGNVIVKTEGEYPAVCENEFFCMQLAERLSLPVPRTWLVVDESGKIHYCIERFGVYRTSDIRVMKEEETDFLEISGRPSNEKYAVTLEELFEMAQRSLSGFDFNNFCRMWYFGAVVGNTDMHAKNFSMFKRENGKYKLTPMYDVLNMPCYGVANTPCLKSMKLRRYLNENEFLQFASQYAPQHELEELKTGVLTHVFSLLNIVFKLSLRERRSRISQSEYSQISQKLGKYQMRLADYFQKYM